MTSHGPEQSVQAARLLTEEIPRGVVGSGSLGDLTVLSWLDSVDEVRELDRILDEKDWDVIPNDI